jgi:hypothetical protein
MNSNQCTRNRKIRGTTLTEVVIAITVMAFSIPFILSAKVGSLQSRQNSEADTRSVWIVGDVKRRIINDWASVSQRSHADKTLIFPSLEKPKSTMKMFFDQQGSLIEEDSDKAVYLVSVEATPYLPTQYQSNYSPLARIKIEIQHPAKAPANKQKGLTYQFVSNRYGL